MTTISMRVEDNFVDTLKTMLRGFVEQQKVQIINENNHTFVLSSVEEVRKRGYEAEERIKNDGGVNEEEYEDMMDDFFTNKLGINR